MNNSHFEIQSNKTKLKMKIKAREREDSRLGRPRPTTKFSKIEKKDSKPNLWEQSPWETLIYRTEEYMSADYIVQGLHFVRKGKDKELLRMGWMEERGGAAFD